MRLVGTASAFGLAGRQVPFQLRGSRPSASQPRFLVRGRAGMEGEPGRGHRCQSIPSTCDNRGGSGWSPRPPAAGHLPGLFFLSSLGFCPTFFYLKFFIAF